MNRELPLGAERRAHGERVLIAQEVLAAACSRVEPEREVNGVGGGDVGESNQAEERRAIGREPQLDEIGVGRHAGIGATVARDASKNPLVARGRGLVNAHRWRSGPIGGITVDRSGPGCGDHRQHDEREEGSAHGRPPYTGSSTRTVESREDAFVHGAPVGDASHLNRESKP
ncbi:MAG: hypothetical protein SFW67_29010 [Myxococcaceae bacterium]|nr:hypothetical protein [Myxococcaceae bacterium]